MRGGTQWQFGTHRAVLEEPDLIRVTFEGPFRFEDAREVLEIYRDVCGERPRYLVADIGRSSMDAATRKYFGSEVDPRWFLGVVYVGADLLLRVITDALTALVFFQREQHYEVRFVDTDQEARELIRSWRGASERQRKTP